MRTAPWVALVSFTTAASGCSGCCQRKGQGSFVGTDATPVATWQTSSSAAWTPPPVDFGSVPVGGTKVLPVKLANTGSLAMDISSVAIVQGQSGTPEFSFAELTNAHAPFGATLQPGSSAVVYVEFQPNRGGEQTATIAVKSNSNATPEYDIPLRGNATNVTIVVDPAALDFGNVQVGTSSTMSVTFTNKGTDTSDPIQVQPVIGTQASDFAWTGTPGALAPNQSFTLQVTFTPAVQGPAAALIPYLDCATCNPQSLSLQGVGVDGQLVFDPDPVQYFNVPGGSSEAQTVTITNTGLAQVSLTSLSTAKPSLFALGNGPALPMTLKPLDSTQVTVTYVSSGGSNDQDNLTAISQPLDDQGNPAQVKPESASDPLVGNGTLNPCSLQIQPPSLNFGNPTIGSSVQKSVTLTNAGQQACNVSGIAIGAGTDAAFTLVSTQTTLTVAPGQTVSAAITVACDIQSSSPPLFHRGTVTFQSNDTNRPNATIPLSAFVKGSGPYADGWPKWHADNTDQGQSQADTSANNGTVIWQFRVGVPQSAGGVLGSVDPNPTYMNSPVVDGSGNVYQLGMDGTFYGIDPGGNELWATTLLPPNPDEHPATPIIAADNTIYIETGCDGAGGLNSNGGNIFHIDAATGKILAQVAPPTDCRTDPSSGQCDTADGFDVNPSIGQDGLLFDGDDFGQTVVYTPGSGGAFSETSHVILPWMGERVAVALDGQDNSYWCCLNICFGVTSPASGFQIMPAWPSSGATIGNSAGGGITGFTNSDLAFDANHTGWLMVEAGTQTGSSGQTEVVAMDPANGSVKWDTPLPSGATPGSFSAFTEQGIFSSDVGNSAPAVANLQGQASDGTVYVGNVDGLYALDGKTGSKKWTFATTSDVDSAPAIGGDGTIFFGTADGTFYAVNPDGSKRFTFKAQGRISSSPAIGPDGTVFFVADDGQLYALR